MQPHNWAVRTWCLPIDKVWTDQPGQRLQSLDHVSLWIVCRCSNNRKELQQNWRNKSNQE